MATASSKRTKARRGLAWSHVVAFLLGCCVSTMILTMFHGTLLHDVQHFEQELTGGDSHNLHKVVVASSSAKKKQVKVEEVEHIAMLDEDRNIHQHDVAGLDCTVHGGPNEPSAAQEMVYWKDLPLDNEFVSPFRSANKRQYLTFEPDGGGWNNIRMSMETVLVSLFWNIKIGE